MANWCEGTFRARGTKENIKKFLVEGLEPISRFNVTEEIKRKIEDYDNSFDVTYTHENQEVDSLYIPYSKRNFMELGYGMISAYKIRNSDDFMFAKEFKGAWSIDFDAIKKIATEYKIDIRVNGYECGMEFEQLYEVDREGTIKCDSFIQYSNYIWECPMPLLGG